MATRSCQGKLDLKTICDTLGSIEHKWFKIGIQLGIPRSKLQKFKKDDDPLSAVIDYWLSGNVPESKKSWDPIVTALKSKYVGEPGLAEEISKDYCQLEDSNSFKQTISAEKDCQLETNLVVEKAVSSDKSSEKTMDQVTDISSVSTKEGSTSSPNLKMDQATGSLSASTEEGSTSSPNDQANVNSSNAQSKKLSLKDEDMTRELKIILEKALKAIIGKYATYVDCLRVAIEEKGVSPDALRSYLLSLSATSQSTEGENLALLSDKKAQLNECNTVIDIFNFLTTECASFLNYDIFQFILKRYGIPDDQEEFKYPEHLKAYINHHKISEFTKINPLLKPKNGSKELIVKFDIETTCRLAKLTDLKKLVAEIMEISSFALEIIDIEEGCVIVTFSIPASVANALFTPATVFTPQQEEKLRAASVLWLKCNGCTFDFETKKKDHKDEAFQKLKEQLTCSICLGTYTDPKQLQCQHAYCQQCLMGLVQQDQQGQPTLTCPTCRQVTPVPTSGVAGLQADFRANQLLEIVGRKEPTLAKPPIVSFENVSEGLSKLGTTPLHCPDHDKILIEIWCGTCEEAICWKCSRDKHHGHDCEALHEAFVRCKEDILLLLQTTDQALTKLDTCCEEISNQRAAVKEEIHNTITVDDRKTELISQLHLLTQAKLKSLAVQRDQIETIQAQLNKHHFMESTSNQREELQMTSTTVKQVKELSTTLQDLLEPKTKADMMFSKGHTTDSKIGVLYTNGSPDPSKCITESGNAAVHKNCITNLEVFNWENRPCMVSTSAISCELVSEIASTRTGCAIERLGKCQYEINYTPTIKGRHQLHVKVEGKHVRGSPFLIRVRSQVDDLGTPTLTITGVKSPRGVVVNKKGEVIVVDGARSCVTVFSPCGERIRSFGTQGSGQGQFRSPCGVALDDKENILVADNNRIQKFTPLGEFVGNTVIGLIQKYNLYGIAFNSSNGRVYAVDDTCHIQVRDSDLSYVYTFGKKGRGEGELTSPRHIACDSTGNVYVADWGNHCIQVFTVNGKFLRMFGRHGEGMEKLKEPYGIAIDYNDRVYVSDQGNHSISIYTPEGQFVTSFGHKHFFFPSGLAVDDCGVVYVCDYANNRVELY